MASPKLRKLNKLLKRRKAAASSQPQNEPVETPEPAPEVKTLEEPTADLVEKKPTTTTSTRSKKRVKKTLE